MGEPLKIPEDKFILDATAGFRMMWFNKKHPHSLYVDNRVECNPDELQDFRHLPYPDESFNLVVFDPPHKIMSDASAKGNVLLKNFGRLLPETWSRDLEQGLSECYRVLTQLGVLIFKWHECDKTLIEIEQYFPCKPLFGQKTNTTKGRNKGKGGIRKPANTYWLCFMKIPEKKENLT